MEDACLARAFRGRPGDRGRPYLVFGEEELVLLSAARKEERGRSQWPLVFVSAPPLLHRSLWPLSHQKVQMRCGDKLVHFD